jgi:hypothetical protein
MIATPVTTLARLISGFLLAAVLAPEAQSATIRYTAEDLGRTPWEPVAINNRGWMVGGGYRYRPGVGWEQLLGSGGHFTDINDSGVAVGVQFVHGGDDIALIRPPGQPVSALLDPEPGVDIRASFINNAGQVIGTKIGPAGEKGFLYTPGQDLIEFGDGSFASPYLPLGLNDQGQVLLYGEDSVALWDPVTGYFNFKDELGLVFGYSVLGGNGIVAYSDGGLNVWIPSVGLRSPGALSDYVSPRDSNERGWTVGRTIYGGSGGWAAALYVYGHGVMDLNDLTSGVVPAYVRLESAVAINDRDQILAQGTNGNWYLLSRDRSSGALNTTENPEPGTWIAGCCGALFLLARRRRRS